MIFTKGGAVMIIDKMDYIFAIAKEQNLTRAAKRLFVAQSTLTMYLNRVEAELGVKLFDRSKTSRGTSCCCKACAQTMRMLSSAGCPWGRRTFSKSWPWNSSC